MAKANYSDENSDFYSHEETDSSKSKSNSKNSGNNKYQKGQKKPSDSNGNGKIFKRNNSSNIKIPNRTIQVSGSKNQNRFSMSNLSSSTIREKHFNQLMITGNYRDVFNKPVVVSLCLVPDNARLTAQATVWAAKIIDTQELILRHIIGSFRSDWEKDLIELFIYSYYRSVLYALNDDKVAQVNGSRYGVVGHALLYKILLKPSFTFTEGETAIKYSFNFSEENYKNILAQAMKFKFISESINNGRRFSLENTILDRNLNSLNDSFTLDEPEMQDMFGESHSLTSCLTRESFPLGNSFYSSADADNGVKDWYYSHKTGTTIFSPSTLFGKACFITSCDDKTHDRYYEKVSQDDNYLLVSDEVTSLCGCSYRDFNVTDPTPTEK